MTLDNCLFMKQDIICVIYVDDTTIAGLDSVAIEELITSLGIVKKNQRRSLDFRDEFMIGDFLGICMEKQTPKSLLSSSLVLSTKF